MGSKVNKRVRQYQQQAQVDGQLNPKRIADAIEKAEQVAAIFPMLSIESVAIMLLSHPDPPGVQLASSAEEGK